MHRHNYLPCSHSATAPPRPAAQYPILDPTTMTSKDFTPWTPTMLPVSEERQPSCFITAPAPPPSTVAEMDNYTLVSQVDYLTMDPIVLEEHVELGEPMDMSQLTCLLWRGVLAVAIVCGIYIVTMEFMNSTMKKDIYASRWRSSVSSSHLHLHCELTELPDCCLPHVCLGHRCWCSLAVPRRARVEQRGCIG